MPEDEIKKPMDFEKLEKRVLCMLLCDGTRLGKAVKFVKPEHFENPDLRHFFKIILTFFERYKRNPTVEEFSREKDTYLRLNPRMAHEFDVTLEEVLRYKEENFDYVWDETVKFCQHAELVNVQLRAGAAHRKEDIAAAIKILEDGLVEIKGMGEAEAEAPLITVETADGEPVPVEWLYNEVFPKNMFSVIMGVQGVGKSFFAMMLAAHVSTGRAWPTNSQHVERGRVLILSAEDDANTVMQRLVWQAADRKMVTLIKAVPEKQGAERWFNLSRDLTKLKALIRRRGDVRLVIIDPLISYMGDADVYKNSVVRAVLCPLNLFAKEMEVTVIGIMHPNKRLGVAAIHSVSGSSAFTEVPRTVWTIAWDKEEEKLRRMAPAKCNLAIEHKKFSFNIENNVIVLREDETTPDADELMSPQTDKERGRVLDRAIKILKEKFKGLAVVAPSDFLVIANVEHISSRTLQRAAKNLGFVYEEMRKAWVPPKTW